MKQKIQLLLLFLLLFSCRFYAQDISLYQQFNGRYDFTFFGNTLNTTENGVNTPCVILTSSSASLDLNTNAIIEKAYLYWAGSGTGDFDIKLNGTPITAERNFPLFNTDVELSYFSAFADVTKLVKETGDGLYTVSDLDLTEVIATVAGYCQNSTNFGGWAILVIYKDETLPLNQLNVYDGMQHVPNEININLSNLNVIDNDGAKIGFIAWEGDRGIAVNETLSMNGVVLSSVLNPYNNAFNGTNSITGATNLYNMDLDIYEVEDILKIGDETAGIKLTSGQDFVMVNAVITKLNSQLPDATVAVNNVYTQCDSKNIAVEYTIYNLNCTDKLPKATPIAFYINNILIEYSETIEEIDIDGSETNTISLNIPEDAGLDFEIVIHVDDIGDGTGIVKELYETNNSYTTTASLKTSPKLKIPENIISCNKGTGNTSFDFSEYLISLKNNPADIISFFISRHDAEQNSNPIINPENFIAQASETEIFVRLFDGNCYAIQSFLLLQKNCPPTVYNFVTPNSDGKNDTFFIEGLRDIFLNFELTIYNRWGKFIWKGNNNTEDWNGIAEHKIGYKDATVPDGTYYYVLELNDPDYPEPIVGWIYVTK